jgi:hypothetical protein
VGYCFRCHTLVPEGELTCLRCGREQYRTCYCGRLVAVTAPVCPSCGAEWRPLHRVRRKSSRHQFKPQKLSRYALAGAAAALMILALGGLFVTVLARQAVPPGQPMPTNSSELLSLAGQALSRSLATTGHRLSQMSGQLLVMFIVLLVGAGLGAFFYLLHEGIISSNLPWVRRRHHSRGRRRAP